MINQFGNDIKMAAIVENQRDPNSGIWSVKGYTIYAKDILGKGAYGIVYKAIDADGKKVAAKMIDISNKHLLDEIITDVEKLLRLDHQNIVKLYDIHQEENVVWVFMELCEYGDLNKFFSKNSLTQQQTLEVMTQIAGGISYLHQNDVVHRDIKPDNILVASNSPIEIKLTDFDVSKFFEPHFDTSAMSTDVGTLAFKAPEFFQRTPEGKLVYHRNVDCYAMGLTFLALLQANKDTKQLKPHIETPQNDSELHAFSVGQLIAERIKYNVKELNIVKTEKVSPKPTSQSGVKPFDERLRIKSIIQKMTCAKAEDRLSADQVLALLQNPEKQVSATKIQ